jgi:RNA polymerase-binding transcription factor DksA
MAKSIKKTKKTTVKTAVKSKKTAKKTAVPKKVTKAAVKPKKISRVKKTVKKAVKPQTRTAKKTVKAIKPAKKQSKNVKKKTHKNKSRYTIRELLHFKNILMDEKKTILESARANMMSLVDKESGDYVGDDLSYASHMAEQGTDEMEREKNYMFVQRDEKYLGYIEEALTRIDNGTYGICIDCIDIPKNLCKTCPLIPRERLEIVPITQHCIECKNIRG